ncbi:MAG: hypothetical protein QXM96_04285 [Candidatus Woesearchaeota archaeon]
MNKKKNLLFVLVFIVFINFYYVNADLNENINKASTEIGDFFNEIEHKDITIITGSKISIEEKMLFNLIKSNIVDLQGIEIITDDYELENQEKYKNKNLVLIGSEKTNIITNKIKPSLNNQKKKSYSPLNIVFSEYNNKKIMIAYSEKEDKNTDNNILEKSFLSNFIDKKYVPFVASFLSILFLYLWNILIKTGFQLGNDLISSKILQKIVSKKKSKKKYLETKKLHQFIEKSEIFAFFLYTIITAIILSYAWSSSKKEFFDLLIINLFIIGFITFIREFARQYYCYKDKVNSEFAFWPFGSLLTLISTFLGNTFSLSCYTLVDENHEKKFGKVSFYISLYTLIMFFISYFFNIIFPSIILQMIFVYSIFVLFIDLFPLSPMSGNDIIKWNFLSWLIIYLIVFVSYIYINFTAYVFYI